MLSFGIVVCKNEGTGNLKHLPRFIGGEGQSFAKLFQKRGNRILHPSRCHPERRGVPRNARSKFWGFVSGRSESNGSHNWDKSMTARDSA